MRSRAWRLRRKNWGSSSQRSLGSFTRANRAVRQADELRRDWSPRWGRRSLGYQEKLARASRPERACFRHLESIIAADIDRAVGAPFPAAVISEEMRAMVMITMPKETMAKPSMAKSMVPVASTVPTVTSSESLTGDGQRSSGQCQSSDCGGNDRLGLRHGRLLLGWAEQGSLCDGPPLEALAVMRCDEDHASWRDHPIGVTWGSQVSSPCVAR